jgi:hypothetical protein
MSRPDMVKVASASCEYDEQKPGAGQRVTLSKIARRNQKGTARIVYDMEK